MLYDNKRFDKELRRLGKLAPEKVPLRQLLKLENLVAWLRTKTPTARYDYDVPDNCMLTQYFKENGYPSSMVFQSHFYLDATLGRWHQPIPKGKDYDLPDTFNAIAHGRNGRQSTFGAALRRAEAHLAA